MQQQICTMKAKRISIVVLVFVMACVNTILNSNSGEKRKAPIAVRNVRSPRKNVLFLITDDMRTQLGCYSGPESVFNTVKMHTPNLDKLAAKSLLFKRAYVQYALCGPSRTSMMTGRRPDTTGVTTNDIYWRDLGRNFTTLPQYFKERGYRSIGYSKIFHKFEDPQSWNDRAQFGNPEKRFLDFKKGGTWLAYSKDNNRMYPLFDTVATRQTIRKLKELAPRARTGERPFFLALGLNKPHVPFVCPEEFFQLYPLENKKKYLSYVKWQTPLVRAGMLNVTMIAGEVRMTDPVLREHRRAYFACISYVDDLIGQVLRALEKFGLVESTVISFVADHGYHLGENGEFGKKLLTDISSQVPMMIHIPGLTNKAIRSHAIVETLDLFPTIAQAAGLEIPPSCPDNSENISLCVQGKSLLPLVKHPSKHIREAAFTQLKMDTTRSDGGNYMGYSMRTSRYRYSEYIRIEETSDSLDIFIDEKNLYSELYDHKLDIEETVNRTAKHEYREIRNELRKKLHNFIKKSNGVKSLKS